MIQQGLATDAKDADHSEKGLDFPNLFKTSQGSPITCRKRAFSRKNHASRDHGGGEQIDNLYSYGFVTCIF